MERKPPIAEFEDWEIVCQRLFESTKNVQSKSQRRKTWDHIYQIMVEQRLLLIETRLQELTDESTREAANRLTESNRFDD